MKTLILYSAYTDQSSYFDDWVDAFREHPNYNATCVNVYEKNCDFKVLSKSIQTVDVIVLHHSMNGDTLKYLMPLVPVLKNRKGKLVSFVGNEVNLITIGMAPKINILKELEVDIIATQLLKETGEWLYADCTRSTVVSLPHALNTKAFHPTKSYETRKLDVGTRSAQYSVCIGDNDRNSIIQFFHKISSQFDLHVDLGLNKKQQLRFNREGWATFLNSCKTTLSTEAGSLYLQRDDSLVEEIRNYLLKNSKKFILPNETQLRKIYRRILPSFLRKIIFFLLKNKLTEAHGVDQGVDFDKIYQKFFSTASKCPFYSKAISSRHFDAIGTKTLQVMYPGRYNDILIPGQHYFELKYDHSNLEEFIDLLKNFKDSKEVVDRTYEFAITKHTHKNRLDDLLKILSFS